MQRVRLVDLRLDEELWQRGSDARKLEWAGAIRDFVETAALELDVADAPAALSSHLQHATNGLQIVLRADAADTAPLVAIAIPRARLGPMIDEYAQICAELGRPGHAPPRLEALDIAKRLVHDEAGEVLQSLLPPLHLDHATARRLFTLIVTVLVDTTQLAIRPHLQKTK